MATTMRAVTKSSLNRIKLVTALVAAAGSTGLYASDWKFDPRIEVREDYTSNLDLTETNEESSFITQILPGFSLNKSGGGLDVDVDYSLQQVEYSSDQGGDTTNHQLSAVAKAELIENNLFVDARTSMSQQRVSNRSASNGTDVNASGSKTDTTTFEISPYWQQRITDTIDAGARLTYNEVNFDSNGGNDSDGYAVNLFVDAQPNNSKLFWGITADKSKATPDNADDIESDEISATLGYRYSPQLSGSISYGYVDNHLNSTTDSDADAGEFWGVSAQWSPGPRTQISASYNSRLQTSNDYGLNFFHRTKHGAWTVNYSESISSVRQQLLQAPVGSIIFNASTNSFRVITPDDPFLGESDIPFLLAGDLTTSISDDRFINKSLTGNFVIVKGKSTYSLGIFSNEREFQSGSLASEEDIGVSLGWTIQLNTNSSTVFTYDWSRLEPDGLAKDTVNTLRIRYNQQLSRKTSVVASLSASDRSSPDSTREFTEESVGVSLLHNF